jgi:NADH-quinone oxidoreductase subunit L
MVPGESVGDLGLFAFAPLVIALPLAGMLINIIIGRRLGERFVSAVASSAVGLAVVVSILQLVALLGQPSGVTVPIAEWIALGSFRADWVMNIDALTVVMMLMVTSVSTLIHIYASGYMHEDVRIQGDPKRFTRFFVYFNLFVAMMMILVTADNYLMLFVGWEGVGLCSYLLIGFWYEKGKDGIGNAIAGKKAFITNRIGDFGLLIAMFIIFWTVGSLRFEDVFHWAHEFGPENLAIISVITLFMLLGVTGKSAQIPLYVWLPDAMAGPTPVSALIHAATMVTAGVYLIVRSSPLYYVAESTSLIVTVAGAATALFAATIAIGQFDIKRVLAYSTISQLGFMVAAAGLGAYVAAMFHLVVHAFFKALLFLSSGSVIQGVEHGHHHVAGEGDHHGGEAFDPQDMRNMGGLRKRMKITFWVYLIGSLALAGLPPLSGFFSKDEILADARAENPYLYILLAVAAFMTAFYMGRQVLMVFFGKPRSDAAEHARENPPVMTVPLIILAVLSVFGGAINLPILHTLTNYLANALDHVHPTEFNFSVAAISVLAATVSIAIAWLVYGRKPLEKGQTDPLRRILGPVFVGMENKWWIDELYDFLFVRPYVWLSHFLAEEVDWRFWHDWFHDTVLARSYHRFTHWLATAFDLGVIDGIANGIGDVTKGAASLLRVVQTGYVRNYALAILAGALLILSYFIFG